MTARDARISIAVYRVDAATGRRQTVRRRRDYPGDDTDLHTLTSRWPPCRCPRCGGEPTGDNRRPPADTPVMAGAVLVLTALTVLLGAVAAWLQLA